MDDVTLMIDGKKRKFLNDVKMLYELPDGSELHVTLTHEGMIADLVGRNGHIVGTFARTAIEFRESVWAEMDEMDEEDDD